MIKLPKISIIIPIYNVEEYITECLQSVMRQTYKGEIECILVDDCGKDNSIAIAEQLIADYKGSIVFHILHHEHNRGLSAARNTGTDAATGDYIYYLDSDDYISDDCIETLVVPLQKKWFDVVIGNQKEFGGTTALCPIYCDADFEINGIEYAREALDSHIPITAWNKLFNLAYVRNYYLQFVPRILHEDIPYSYLVAQTAQSIYVSTKVGYYYRIRTSSIIGNLSDSSMKERDSWISVWNILRNYIASKPFDEIGDQYLYKYAMQVLAFAAKQGLPYKEEFRTMYKAYPYHPFLEWLAGHKSLRWLKKRMVWWLPLPLAYRLLQYKLRKK